LFFLSFFVDEKQIKYLIFFLRKTVIKHSKGKNCKNFSLIGSVYFLLVRGRLSSSFLCSTPSEGGDVVVKNGVDARFRKVYFGEYDHNSENEGKISNHEQRGPSGKNVALLNNTLVEYSLFKMIFCPQKGVPNKVPILHLPYKAPGNTNPVERSKSDFHPLHTRKMYCFMTHRRYS